MPFCSATCAIADDLAGIERADQKPARRRRSAFRRAHAPRRRSNSVSPLRIVSSGRPRDLKIAGAMSTPRWQSWPMPASKPERGNSTPTFRGSGVGAHDVERRSAGDEADADAAGNEAAAADACGRRRGFTCHGNILPWLMRAACVRPGRMMPDLFVRSQERKGRGCRPDPNKSPSRTRKPPLRTLLTWTTIAVNTNIVARRTKTAKPQGRTTSKTALRLGDAQWL